MYLQKKYPSINSSLWALFAPLLLEMEGEKQSLIALSGTDFISMRSACLRVRAKKLPIFSQLYCRYYDFVGKRLKFWKEELAKEEQCICWWGSTRNVSWYKNPFFIFALPLWCPPSFTISLEIVLPLSGQWRNHTLFELYSPSSHSTIWVLFTGP